jgi:hypothetical protein
MKSAAIADILSTLNDELGRLNDLEKPGERPSDAHWETVRIVLQAYHAIEKIRAEDVDHARLGRINGEGGALSWCGRSFAEHPDRCECQGSDPLPHRHYGHAPYRCARCSKCNAYTPVAARSKEQPNG